jgi:hypothetical protein
MCSNLGVSRDKMFFGGGLSYEEMYCSFYDGAFDC